MSNKIDLTKPHEFSKDDYDIENGVKYCACGLPEDNPLHVKTIKLKRDWANNKNIKWNKRDDDWGKLPKETLISLIYECWENGFNSAMGNKNAKNMAETKNIVLPKLLGEKKQDKLSLCPKCYCMTKKVCGKCSREETNKALSKQRKEIEEDILQIMEAGMFTENKNARFAYKQACKKIINLLERKL